MNTTPTNDACFRVEQLKRKILLRNSLSFLICLIPLAAAALWAFWAGGLTAKLLLAFLPVLILLTLLLYHGDGRKVSNFLFDADFVVQAERYAKIQKDIHLEKIYQEAKEEELKNADIINRLEADLRAAGVIKDA